MRSRILILSSFVALSSLLGAQVSVDLVAYGNWSGGGGGASGTPILSGTPIVNGSAVSGSGINFCGASGGGGISASVIDPAGGSGLYSCVLSASGFGSSAFSGFMFCTASGSGFGAVAATLTAPTPTIVRIMHSATASGGAGLFGASTSFSIDGIPSSVMTTGGSASQSNLLVVGPQGVTLRLRVQAFGNAQGSASASGRFSFLVEGEGPGPAGVTLTPTGVSCGPVLTGSLAGPTAVLPAFETLDFEVSGSPIWDAPFLVFGTNPLASPLPSSPGCSLQTEIAFAVPLGLMSTGTTSFQIPLTASVGPFVLRAQYLIGRIGTTGLAEWRSSGVLEVAVQ